jgi:hypothetical protein
MKRLMFAAAIAVLVIPVLSLVSRPAYGQDGGGFGADSIDLTGLLGDGNRGGGNRGGRGNFQLPDSKVMFADIQSTLKKGKTPLEKAQEKPLQSLLDAEVVALSDKIQLLRNNNNNNNQNFPNNFPQNDQARGNRGGNQPANGAQTPQQPNAQAIQVDTITSLKNDDFIATKLSLFLSPEQVALVQKAHADDKANANCLGGLLDRYYNQLQNPNRGNNNNPNFNNQNRNNNTNNNNNNNATRPNGQKYCMTMEATPTERLEPIRKVLAKGNLPLAKDKDMLAEIVMKSELQDLESALRAGLTGGGNNNRGNNNNRNNNPQQVIQSSMDATYKKVEAMLNPQQAEVIKQWQYTQMLDREGVDRLIAIEAMQDTPLTDEQIAKVTAAWPEFRNQIEQAAKAANKSITAKQRDEAAMNKLVDMLEPSQVASYQLAKKYGPQVASGK